MIYVLILFGIIGAQVAGFLFWLGHEIVKAEQERYRLMTIWRNEHITAAQLRRKCEHECVELNRRHRR